MVRGWSAYQFVTVIQSIQLSKHAILSQPELVLEMAQACDVQHVVILSMVRTSQTAIAQRILDFS